MTVPLSDELVARCMETVRRVDASSGKGMESKLMSMFNLGPVTSPRFLPTTTLRVFETLHEALPGHNLVPADFRCAHIYTDIYVSHRCVYVHLY